MKMTTNYKGYKILVRKQFDGFKIATHVHVIGPRMHKILKHESGYLAKAIKSIDLRLQGRII